jgi:acyl-CoA thioesterase-1
MTLGLCLLIGLMWPMAPRTAAPETPFVIVALGDSLMAGWGLEYEESLPVQLEAWLNAKGVPVQVIDASVSGDTTAGGIARLDWVLGNQPDLVIVELGANDALRGLDPETTRSNLDVILEKLRDRRVKILLAGMRAPPNLGDDYAGAFNPIYRELADKHGIMLYPFILEGVAARPELNQDDGMHPNTRGVAAIVERLGPIIRRMIESE